MKRKSPDMMDRWNAPLHALIEDTGGFAILASLLEKRTGIVLRPTEKNRTLMASRLFRAIRARGLERYADYVRLLREGAPSALEEFTRLLTTNTTEFYREPRHFEFLASHVPELVKRKEREGNREIRIWSAAASTGQEAYSLAFTFLDRLERPESWTLRILATDINGDVLRKASAGIYTEQETQRLPADLLARRFDRIDGARGPSYQVKAEVRRLIRFAAFNLQEPGYPFRFPFDVIFCRNVLIYFEHSASKSVIAKLASHLAPGGLLFVGHSETGLAWGSGLKAVRHAVYEKQ